MLEICCDSYYNIMQTASGGAGRIELNCTLHLGGFAPSLTSLGLMKKYCNAKVIAMVRPRGSGFCYNKEDSGVTLKEYEYLVCHGADGVVFGYLKGGASTDREGNTWVISIIHSYGKEAIFHRVFDCTSNPCESIGTLVKLGTDRLLTSGPEPKVVGEKALFDALQSSYGNNVEILAGGGINASDAKTLVEETGIRQAHSSRKDWMTDPTTISYRVTYGFTESPHENCHDVVSEALVHKLLNSLGRLGR